MGKKELLNEVWRGIRGSSNQTAGMWLAMNFETLVHRFIPDDPVPPVDPGTPPDLRDEPVPEPPRTTEEIVQAYDKLKDGATLKLPPGMSTAEFERRVEAEVTRLRFQQQLESPKPKRYEYIEAVSNKEANEYGTQGYRMVHFYNCRGIMEREIKE